MKDKKADIFRAARELFHSKGFKETNISEIAKLAGIGTGTFYNYYPSKESIFIEVYLKENELQKMSMFESMNFDADPVSLVTNMIKQNAADMNSNLILREWYNKELFSKLEKLFLEQNGLGSIDELSRSGMAELIRKWKADGKIRDDLDDEMIIAILNSILYIDLHKDEIGLAFFPQILFHITEFIMKGLTDTSKVLTNQMS